MAEILVGRGFLNSFGRELLALLSSLAVHSVFRSALLLGEKST